MKDQNALSTNAGEAAKPVKLLAATIVEIVGTGWGEPLAPRRYLDAGTVLYTKSPAAVPEPNTPVPEAAPVQPATINGEPATAHSLLAALVDIHDDAAKYAPENRCYVEEAWPDALKAARAFLAAPLQQEAMGEAPFGGSILGHLGQDDLLKVPGDVHERIPLTAADAQEENPVPVDLRFDSSEHHHEAAASALPHGDSPVEDADGTTAPTQQDAVDAARYRFWRSYWFWDPQGKDDASNCPDGIVNAETPEDLDAAIDAKIAALQPTQGAKGGA